ncbi:MAG: hypothetical protein M3O06_00700, partial [Pseudomonadota bacterium]|nr:hypothetical protein [Pseudomonadota bacterium]
MRKRPNTAARPPRRRLALALFLTAAVLLLVACGTRHDGAIVIASVSDVSSLDPHLLDSNHPTGSVIWSLFDSLV